SRDAKRLDRSQATSGTGRAAHEFYSAKREAGGGAQTHRGPGYRGFSEDRGAGHQSAVTGVERHRSHRKTGDEQQRESDRNRKPEKWAALGAGTAIARPA